MSIEKYLLGLGELAKRIHEKIKLKPRDIAFVGRESTLIVTDECNLRCTYCYCTDKKPFFMSWETAKAYIDTVFENGKDLYLVPKEEQIEIDHRKLWSFIGGEPLLAANLVFKCMHYIKERTEALPINHPWARKDWPCSCGHVHDSFGYRFAIGTNGLLLHNREIREELQRWSATRLLSLAVTLDGPKEMHDACRVDLAGGGSWDKVVSIWPWLKVYYPGAADSTKSTIAPENLEYLVEVDKFFIEEMGLTDIQQNCVFENVWTRGEHLILFDKLCTLADWLIESEKYKTHFIRWFEIEKVTGISLDSDRREDNPCGKWCGSGKYMDACDHTGNLFPCLRFKTLVEKTPYTIGNVKDGFNAERRATLSPDRSDGSKQKRITGLDCNNCLVKTGCGDCQAVGYDAFGEMDVKSPWICAFHKATVFANIYFFGQLLGVVKKEERDFLMVMLDEYTKDAPFKYASDGTEEKQKC